MMSFSKDKMAPLKAVMALMIVADHMSLFYGVAFLRPFIELGAPIVSMFFFISGYGLHVSYSKKGEAYLKNFFSRRLWKILAPFLIATVLFIILSWMPLADIWDGVIKTFTEGNPILPFSWFIIEILLFYLAFYLSYRFFGNKWRTIILCLFVIALMILFYFLHYGNGWWVSSLAFPAGIVFAKYESSIYSYLEKRPARYWFSLFALLAGFACFYIAGKHWERPYLWTVCYIFIPLIVAIIVARVPVQKLNVKAVAFLAMISYEIYLCQGISMELLRSKLYIQSDAVFVLAVYALTIALAYGVHKLSALITAKQ